jgi:formylglycine-generating enzyme required for sulfatase activity
MRFLFFSLILAVTVPGWAAEESSRSSVETIPGTLVKFEMVSIPGATVAVADPAKPGAQRQETVAPFAIGKTEVTWDEYDVFVFQLDLPEEKRTPPPPKGHPDAASRPSRPYGAPDRGFGHQGYPVISVTFHAAEQYCRWLSAKTGKKYRLPTEAEWEYACRAGAGSSSASTARTGLEQHAWFWDNADDTTHPVGKKGPNAWGLHDMLGNAAEWCPRWVVQ